MVRKYNAPETPIIYHSLEDSKRPNHEKIEPFESVAEVLKWEEGLRREFFGESDPDDRLKEIWFRGTRKHFPLAPGIYRTEITGIANDKRRDWLLGDDPPRNNASALELKRVLPHFRCRA
jgi:hypothetical protein